MIESVYEGSPEFNNPSATSLEVNIVKSLNEQGVDASLNVVRQELMKEHDPLKKAELVSHIIGLTAVKGGGALREIPALVNNIIALTHYAPEDEALIRQHLGPIADPERIGTTSSVRFPMHNPALEYRINGPQLQHESCDIKPELTEDGWLQITGRDSLTKQKGIQSKIASIFYTYVKTKEGFASVLSRDLTNTITDVRYARNFILDEATGIYRLDIHSEDMELLRKIADSKMASKAREFVDRTETGFFFQYSIASDGSILLDNIDRIRQSSQEGQTMTDPQGYAAYRTNFADTGKTSGSGHTHYFPSFFSMDKNQNGKIDHDMRSILHGPELSDKVSPTPSLVLIGKGKGFLYLPGRGITVVDVTMPPSNVYAHS